MQAPLSAARDTPHEAWRPDIAGLRGLAVLLVVAYHLQMRGAGGGFIGVDVFFVISGYLMTQIILGRLSQGVFGYWRFMGDRAARIWPALAFMVGMLLLLGAWALPPFDLRTLADQAWRALLFWSNQYFHDRSGYATRTADTHWMLHTWSLSVEWQFYLLYPLVLAGLARLKLGRWGFILAIAVLLLASLGCQVAWSATHPTTVFFLLPARAWEMLAGGLAFLLAPAGANQRSAWRMAMHHGGLACVLVSAVWLGMRHVPAEGAGWYLVLPVIGSAMLLYAPHTNSRVLGSWPLQRLGLWSYSIYLWHWPLIVGLRLTDVYLDHPHLSGIGIAVASVVLGGLSFHWIESRAGPGCWRRLRKPLIGMGVAVAMTGLVVLTHGLAFRSHGADFGTGYAASVRKAYFPDACSNFMKTAEETRVCEVPKGATSRRILVIGDSHAEQLYAWFVAHSAVPVDFFTQAECPPVPNFDRMQNGFHCQDYAQAAWSRAALDRYDTVVLASRWAGIGLNGAPYCHTAAASNRCAPVEGEQKQALVRDELRKSVEGLLASHKTVVMLMPTPEARVRVPERILRERFWYGETRLSIDEHSLIEATQWLLPLFDALKTQPGFHLLSLNDKLCSGGVCKVYDTALQRPVYIDESHLDPLWMAANGAVLAPFVRP